MKKFGKILSSVLAASMVVSAFAVNAFAASTAHTVTISADKTTALKAGDSVVVEVKIDNTAKISSCEYFLSYDASAFEIDTTKGQKIGMKKYENFIDIEWYKAITNGDESPWQVFVGAPTYGYPTGQIAFTWAGSEGIDPEYAVDNDVIGKFKLTVKADAADGDYAFSLTGATGDVGENSGADMTCAPITVKVGEDAPVVPPVTYDGEAKGAFSFEVGPKYNGNEGFKVFFKETNTDTKAETTKYAEVAKPAVFDDQTTIESGMTVDFGVKVSGVPSNVVLELLRAEWLETLTVK